MLSVDIQVDDAKVLQMLLKVRNGVSGTESTKVNKAASVGLQSGLQAYYRQFNRSGKWKGKRYLGPSQDSGSFGSKVAQSWKTLTASPNRVVMENNAPYFPIKVRGGTIRPVRATKLTVPLIKEARGLSTREYEAQTGRRLFAVKGKKVLFEKTDTGVRSVYALMSSITQRKWNGALPPSTLVAQEFVDSYITEIRKLIV